MAQWDRNQAGFDYWIHLQWAANDRKDSSGNFHSFSSAFSDICQHHGILIKSVFEPNQQQYGQTDMWMFK